MPGVDLNLDLPSLGDTFASILAKWNVAFSAIEDDLAAKVVPAEISINAALSMGGNYLTNTGAVTFLPGNAPTTAGSLYYKSGEFFVRNSTGELQVTSGVGLNTASVGAIVGDYGGGNPARVSYDDISGEYRFTEDTGVRADVDVDDVILHSASGSVRLGVDNNISTSRQLIYKSLPSSGVSLLVYNSSTSTVEDHNTVITNTVSLSTVTAATDIKHTFDRSARMPIQSGQQTGGTIAFDGVLYTTSGGAGTWRDTMRFGVGDRLKSIRVTLNKTTGGTATVDVYKVSHTGVLPSVTQSFTTAASGVTTLVCTISVPTALALDEDYHVVISLPASGDSIRGVTKLWDHP